MKTSRRLNLIVAYLVEALPDAGLRRWIVVDMKNDSKSVFLFETK
jgi:hypothetical protein